MSSVLLCTLMILQTMIMMWVGWLLHVDNHVMSVIIRLLCENVVVDDDDDGDVANVEMFKSKLQIFNVDGIHVTALSQRDWFVCHVL